MIPIRRSIICQRVTIARTLRDIRSLILHLVTLPTLPMTWRPLERSLYLTNRYTMTDSSLINAITDSRVMIRLLARLTPRQRLTLLSAICQNVNARATMYLTAIKHPFCARNVLLPLHRQSDRLPYVKIP